MAVAGILNNVLFHATNLHAMTQKSGVSTPQQAGGIALLQNGVRASQQSGVSAFQQLGQDLQAGNLAAAQTEFAALTQSGSSTQLSANNSISQEFNTLGQALQAGNLTAAQQDFTALQQSVQQSNGAQGAHHHHHHHGGGSSSNSSSQQTDPISEAFGSLGSDLQSGNLSGAQQAYSTIQADIAQFAASQGVGGSDTSSTPGQSTDSGFSVSV